MKYGSRRKTLTKKNVIRYVAVLATVAIAIVGVFAAITSIKTIPSSGTIAGVNLGVFSDSGCTIPVTSINWGNVTPGGSVTHQVYIENSGTNNMTLSLSNSSWSPSGVDANLTLTWDKEGANVNLGVPNAVLATLTLTASASFTTGTDFSVNVIIAGTHN